MSAYYPGVLTIQEYLLTEFDCMCLSPGDVIHQRRYLDRFLGYLCCGLPSFRSLFTNLLTKCATFLKVLRTIKNGSWNNLE